MVALAGIVCKSNGSIAEPLVKMVQSLKHRGGSQLGIYMDGRVEFSSDLDNLDLTALKGAVGLGAGFNTDMKKYRQPYCSDDRAFILDGEVYPTGDPRGSEGYSDIQAFANIFDEHFNENDMKGSSREIIENTDGGFSFGVYFDNKLMVGRDVIGITPMFIGENDEHKAFASEKKALWKLGIVDNIRPITPGECVIIGNNKLGSFVFRDKLDNKVVKIEFQDCLETVEKLLFQSVKKRLDGNECALLFSGGLDSAIIAHLIKGSGIDVQLFCAAFKNSKDFQNSTMAAKILGLPLHTYELTDDDIIEHLETIVYHLEGNDTVTAEIATPFYFATRQASERGFMRIFAGQGADELFAGYSRYEKILRETNYEQLHTALYNDVLDIWRKNLLRDDRICMANTVALELPYLDTKLVEYCLKIPPEYKLKLVGDALERKFILRSVGKRLGLDNSILCQPKLAVQYGSGASKSFKRIGSRLGFDPEQIRSHGFHSSNELMMNIICHRLGFPKQEIMEPEFVRWMSRKSRSLSKL